MYRLHLVHQNVSSAGIHKSVCVEHERMCESMCVRKGFGRVREHVCTQVLCAMPYYVTHNVMKFNIINSRLFVVHVCVHSINTCST